MTRAHSVGILETGVPPSELLPRHGRYDGMVRRMLGEDRAYRSYDVPNGELPAAPDAHAAYVITGSPAGVYDPLAWIAPLEAFIRAAHGRARMVGICFGHQIMAQALGGRVEKSVKGWGLGLHDYAIVAAMPWMAERVPRIAVAASHQDQVVVPPASATVLASSDFTPFAALAYAGAAAVSVQFHPEFEHDFAAALITRRDWRLDQAVATAALASLEAPGDSSRVAGWLRRFIDEG